MIPLRHHVFTTFGGYGSLRSSEDLAEGVREALDERVAPLAGGAGSEPVRSAFPVGPYTAITSAFLLGRDHAGRPRAVAHTVLIERERVRGLPWFSPLRVSRALFIAPATASQAIEGALVSEAPEDVVAPPVDPDAVRLEAKGAMAAALLASLVARKGRTAVVGDPRISFDRLATLAPLVPPSRGADVAVLSGVHADGVPAALEAARGASAVVLLARTRADVAEADDLALVEERTGSVTGRLPRGLATFALSAFLTDNDPIALAVLEACYARWSEEGAPVEPPRAFVRAFAALRPWVREDGAVALQDQAFPAVVAAIPAAAEGAVRGLAQALLQEGGARAIARHDPEAMSALLRSLRESAAAAPLPEEPRRFLAAEVAALMRRLSEGPDALKRWREASPEALRAVAHEAEAVMELLVEEE